MDEQRGGYQVFASNRCEGIADYFCDDDLDYALLCAREEWEAHAGDLNYTICRNGVPVISFHGVDFDPTHLEDGN